jgi:hypothetical protein
MSNTDKQAELIALVLPVMEFLRTFGDPYLSVVITDNCATLQAVEYRTTYDILKKPTLNANND